MYKENTLEQLLKTKKISQKTYDKVTIAKEYIERKYNLKTVRILQINTIAEKINALNLPQEEKEKLISEYYSKESQKLRKKREKMSVRDYIPIHIIGRGAFGEVRVCREKKTNEIVAIKKIRKDVLVVKNQIIHTRNEQQFLSKVKSPWIVDLKASFQEGDYLYLVMEYLPGGDLMNLLIQKDIFTEEEARFYTAELILAVENIHKFDCIHRDIKPDNILIGKDGHIKLSDFGLAKVSEKIFDKNSQNSETTHTKTQHKKNYSCVGTANYVAPEVLCKKGYGPEIDWWSVGVIFFEMLCGYAPFCSKETSEVCSKILNWEKFLTIPKKAKMSKEAEDLIFKMVRGDNSRLGKNGANEIKNHPFFRGVDWENIRSTKAPFIPELKNDYDSSYFETLEENKDDPFYPIGKSKKRKEVEYIGYTYKNDEDDEEDDDYYSVMEVLDKIKNKEKSSKNNSNNFKSEKEPRIEEIEPTEIEESHFNKDDKFDSKNGTNKKNSSNNLKDNKSSFESKKKNQIVPLKKIVIPNKKDINKNGAVSTKTNNSGTPSGNRKDGKQKLSPNPKRPSLLQRLAVQIGSKKSSNSPKVLSKNGFKK